MLTLDELRDADQRAGPRYVACIGIACQVRDHEPLARRLERVLRDWLDYFQGVRLVVVFDGKPPPEKEATLDARRLWVSVRFAHGHGYPTNQCHRMTCTHAETKKSHCSALHVRACKVTSGQKSETGARRSAPWRSWTS